MNVIDLHCDTLLKLWQTDGGLDFSSSSELDVNLERLKRGGVQAQAFAVFMYPDTKTEDKYRVAIEQIHYFYTHLLTAPGMRQLRSWPDFGKLAEEEIGAFLTLEGVDAIGNDIAKLHKLLDLGVLSVGLTWNNANLAADGAGEPRGAGLTAFGREVVGVLNDRKRLTDVSHLSERAFWDVMETADYPFASHSNAFSLCAHPRNLKDEQAQALFAKRSPIHVVYCPAFIKPGGNADVGDLVRHIDHFCSLGGEQFIGLGSDFDGITEKVKGLETAGEHVQLLEELLKYYTEAQVRNFASGNFTSFIDRIEKVAN